MSEGPPHLLQKAAEYLDRPDAERIDYIRSPRWIGYPRAQGILDQLEKLLTHPKSHRMPNLLIVGDTNNGKTMLVKRFCSRHKRKRPTIAVLPVVQQSGLISSVNSPSFHARAMAASRRVSSW